MKVALITKDRSFDSDLDIRFARGNFILIYDTENESHNFIKNDTENTHGAGPKMIECIVKNGVDAIIAHSLGKNAFDAAKAAGMKVFESSGGNAVDNIKKMTENDLHELNTFSGDHINFK
jgi:predicted Fe-Mo cluster-binding NifX family protein